MSARTPPCRSTVLPFFFPRLPATLGSLHGLRVIYLRAPSSGHGSPFFYLPPASQVPNLLKSATGSRCFGGMGTLFCCDFLVGQVLVALSSLKFLRLSPPNTSARALLAQGDGHSRSTCLEPGLLPPVLFACFSVMAGSFPSPQTPLRKNSSVSSRSIP